MFGLKISPTAVCGTIPTRKKKGQVAKTPMLGMLYETHRQVPKITQFWWLKSSRKHSNRSLQNTHIFRALKTLRKHMDWSPKIPKFCS